MTILQAAIVCNHEVESPQNAEMIRKAAEQIGIVDWRVANQVPKTFDTSLSDVCPGGFFWGKSTANDPKPPKYLKPIVLAVEKLFPKIQEELLELLADPFAGSESFGKLCGDRSLPLPVAPAKGFRAKKQFAKASNGWGEMVLFEIGCFTQNCEKLPSACQGFSEISQVVGERGGRPIAGQITVFRLRPGTKLRSHAGTSNQRLTGHLGLIVPPGPPMIVGGRKRKWLEGRAFVFDDSYIHSVEYPREPAQAQPGQAAAKDEKAATGGGKDRYVLYLSIWHPDVPHQLPRS